MTQINKYLKEYQAKTVNVDKYRQNRSGNTEV